MGFSETIGERDGYRVRLVIEEGADKPYDDGQAPLLRIERSHALHIQVGSRPADSDDRIEEAARRWGRSDLRNLEKYLRAYHGVTQVEVYRNNDWTYVAYDSAEWRAYVGFDDRNPVPAELHMMDEWKAWCEGEVYYYVVEKDTEWSRVGDGREHMHTWETVDSCGGYYGDTEYTRSEALWALKHAIEEHAS